MLSGSREQAEDLVQNALVKTFRSGTPSARAERPIAYVRTIVVREHVSWWRRLLQPRGSRRDPGPTSTGDLPDAEIAETDAMWRLLAQHFHARQRVGSGAALLRGPRGQRHRASSRVLGGNGPVERFAWFGDAAEDNTRGR